MAGWIAGLIGLMYAKDAVKCTLENDRMAQNVHTHQPSGVKYYYDRKMQAHVADTGAPIVFEGKSIKVVGGGYYYNHELEEEKRKRAEGTDSYSIYKRKTAEYKAKIAAVAEEYPDSPFEIDFVFKRQTDNYDYPFWILREKKTKREIYSVGVEEVYGQCFEGRLRTYHGMRFALWYGISDEELKYSNGFILDDWLLLSKRGRGIEISESDYIYYRTEIIKMYKYADKYEISLWHYYDALKRNAMEDLYVYPKAAKYVKWREEMEAIDSDYKDKVWTEEWQRKNLKKKFCYSGMEVPPPKEITDENSFDFDWD